MECLNVDVWLKDVRDKVPALSFISKNSISIEAVRAMFTSDARDTILSWRKAFVAKPLLKISETEYLFPFPYGVQGALGRGLFFRLAKGYNNLYDRKTGDLFFSYFGRFMEDYVDDFFLRSLRKNNARLLRDMQYQNQYSGDNRLIDDIIIEGSNAAFVEVCAKRFRLDETVIKGDIEALMDDLTDMIIIKAEQLAESIKRFRGGMLGSKDVAKVKDIFPVIIVDEFPHVAGALKLVKDELARKNISLPNLQIIPVNELEMLENALHKGRAFTSILKSKCKRRETAEMSLKHFIIRVEPRLHQGRLPSVLAAQTEWFSKVRERTREWGLAKLDGSE